MRPIYPDGPCIQTVDLSKSLALGEHLRRPSRQVQASGFAGLYLGSIKQWHIKHIFRSGRTNDLYHLTCMNIEQLGSWRLIGSVLLTHNTGPLKRVEDFGQCTSYKFGESANDNVHYRITSFIA